MTEDLFLKNCDCPLCGKAYATPRVKRSKLRPSKVESDFCIRYKGLNPIYYQVMVCPNCGYSYTEHFSPLRPQDKEMLKKRISPAKNDFTGERTLELAVESYKRALLCAMMKKEKHSLLAALNLHLAWLYRFAEDKSREEEFLQRARDYYLKMYEEEADIKDLARVVYLIGELNRRLGNIKEAGRWFTRVINDKEINDRGIIRMARERWQELRLNQEA
ncbi:MAG: DUF2225 domain-containing protein [Firmicutes bacterium]|nr:DUF2225 domain-containing protein [Bacillota bacterium]